ncbi:LysR substrate-binding domain-containing protein [Paraburkholderia sediminicola]|uniref:LysR substrate-binding domain-containing protein n=1 Tax=Paraburkholderia sediminicola TaxID=458836 RepID=UPI0038B96F7E
MSSPSFSLRQLRYFMAVAEAGKIRAAADRVGVSETGLAGALSELEEELGVQLLIRRKAHGVTLTSAGTGVLAQARVVLAAADQLHACAHNAGQSPTGELVIGIYTTLAPFLLPSILSGFTVQYPGVQIRFIEGPVLELQAALREGRCEVAIMYDIGIAPDVVSEPLYEIYPSVLISETHRLANNVTASLPDFANDPIILFDVPPARANVIAILCAHNIAPTIAYESSNFELVRALVARNFGFTIAYQLPPTGVSYDGLRLISHPIRDPACAATVVILRPSQIKLTSRAQAFIDFCLCNVLKPGVVVDR